MQRYKHLLVVLCAIAGVFAGVQAVADAQAVTRAYKSDGTLQRGMIVRLAEKDNTKVEALKPGDIEKMEGVIVAANDAPVTLSESDAKTQQVFVATTGRYSVLVSNQNGSIKKDDYITISALSGIGMKAGENQSMIVGKALSEFDGKSTVSGVSKVKTSEGQTVDIMIGFIAVDISISHNPLEAKKSQILPGFELLQSAAGIVINEPVPASRLYLGFFVLLLTMIVSGLLLYAGVRTSVTAVGRNPLAKGSITRNLVQVVVISIIILIIGLVGVYLILKL